MTQRDRLAEVLHLEAFECDLDYDGYCGPSSHMGQADVLLVRGVRVVDVDTLSRALLEAASDGPGIRAEAEAILAALDAGE